MLERELFAILEGTADGAFAVDEHGLVRSWNRAAEKLFGYKQSEVLDKPCADLFQGKGSLGNQVCVEPCSVIECAINHREVSNYDMEVQTRSGKGIWVNVSILAFHDQRTHRHLVVHLTRDVTARKKSEKLSQKLMNVAREISALPDDSEGLPPVSPLTEQERRVLELLAKGKSPSQVARELGITPRTLRNHLHHANQKLHTRNRLEAVMQAARRGLI
ncbi:MAG: PAS domain S-box protein [Acidobacteria bacterium]|nr:MAG: PAS domain S-box protein [Acidobacteriota bacterium]